ncbi:MAG TPA: Do family serine endopeptidase [Vicinamibacteria bacterium]
MNTRTRTFASFFTVAMAAMLLGAVVTTQIRQPAAALARAADPGAQSNAPRPQGPVTLDTFRDIARMQTTGVVNVSTKKVVRASRNRDLRDFFGDDMMERFFGGPQAPPQSQTQQSLGSGFIVDKDGYVMTNRHVVEGADQIQVTLANGKTYDAKLVGRDARTDVALLKIEPRETLTVMNLGNSDQSEVGEWVMAIGSPFGLGNSVTVGVVSFKGRPLGLGVQGTSVDMIQTDASINPGNSGGPLINTRGEVIGINTLIITRGAPQSAGVGFAVPINVAKEILPQLREKGRVVRGWLGVSINPVTDDLAQSLKLKDPKGAYIADVTDGSPADKAGLKPDDVVVSVDGRPIADNGELSRYIASKPPGTTVKLQVVRKGAERTVPVTLGTFPEREEGEDEQGGARHGQLGMTLQDLTPALAEQLELPRSARGVVVMDVEAGSAADNATPTGLQRGDVIVSVNAESVDSVKGFQNEIDKAKADGVARLRVRRGTVIFVAVLRLR